MPYVEILSTATNTWSTLVAATAGWLLATMSSTVKSRIDEHRRLQRIAVAVRDEVAMNGVLIDAWKSHIARENSLSGNFLLPGPSTPLETTALAYACSSGAFDQLKNNLGFTARNLLTNVRGANYTAQMREMMKATSSRNNIGEVNRSLNEIILRHLSVVEDVFRPVQADLDKIVPKRFRRHFVRNDPPEAIP